MLEVLIAIEEITVKDLKDNFDCFYRPANCHLVLVGDFDVENIYTFVNEKQSKFTPPERIVEKEKHLIESDIQKLDSLQMEIFISKLAIGLRVFLLLIIV